MRHVRVGADECTLADLLAWMDDDEPVQLTFTVRALKRALEMAAGGPRVMSTSQAARIFGWTPKRWRSWAEASLIEGAWKDEQRRWRLPNASCRLRASQVAPAARRQSATHEIVPDLQPHAASALHPSIRRGSRRPRG